MPQTRALTTPKRAVNRVPATNCANGANGRVSDRAADELLTALAAARDGDFSVRVRKRRRDDGLAEITSVFNEFVGRVDRMSKEFKRVSRVVGREGRMTERASLPAAGGSWGETVNSVNVLIDDLVRPTTEVARVIEAVAEGDLSQKMALKIEGQPVKGEFQRIGSTVNAMVDQLSSFADEVSRVAKEVGTEGKLGGQAQVKGVSGRWRELTQNVNLMASNLTDQVRNIAQVTTAVARGDLTQKITVDVQGEILELKNTMNTMVDQLSSFADEVTRVAKEVGTEGKLGGQAQVKDVSGTWRNLTDGVNLMASNLTSQVRNIAQVATAVAEGDLSQKITVEATGEVGALADTINSMTGTLQKFAEQVTGVAREVGTDGKLGGQAEVPGVAGTWKDLTDSVNLMASNLTDQVRNIAQVATAVANGDLTQEITVDARGEILQLKNTINTMVDQLSSFADEVSRVAKEVGTEGKLGGQAEVKGVSGRWRELTENVNFMASNLTNQVRNIAQVTTAVAKGDLSQKIAVEAKGEVAALADTINSMTDTLQKFAEQVIGVAREVGTEGKLGGQAEVPGVAGTWKDLTENVNLMASNLTSQVRNIAQVATAVAEGDLSQKITVEATGEVGALADTINSMTDTLQKFAQQVTGVAREVGTDGKLGGQAEVPGVAGTWKDLTDSVNFMASNLTSQVRNIAQVTTAVADGDLTQKITVDAKGEILELKNTINTMVDQLSSFADEVSRVAKEVGTEGKLGGQAEVKGVSGRWRELTENVNFMASNLTDQVRNIAQVTTAVANGDLTQKIAVEAKGEVAALADTINKMVDQLRSFAAEVTRVAKEVGTEGKLGGQAEVRGVAGTWKDLTDGVNFMASNLTSQVRNIAQVATAVATGDLSQKITVDAKGEILELKDTINTMVEQLSSFADEVTRVAREVGTEGKLGGQAQVAGVSGAWRGLTENVNFMASNLTDQVRNIAQVATAVANGDLTQEITVDAKGEILELKDTINTMVEQLSSFADEVTRVAREVGTEGKLGGQAEVKGVSGTWRGLTENVNMMASNLTDQVRNIAQVTTAVANGDLSKKITVDARGEILELKDTINTMVEQLRSFAAEVTRVAKEVGTEGRLGGQAEVEGVSGTWRGLTENVNMMASNLTDQVRNIAQVTTAVANGDLSKKITVDARGEILELKDTINTMVEQLRSFAAEVTRVAKEVGTEGNLGGQAEVEGVSGTWRGLTESVNLMASNLTDQVRNIAQVATAVARGDLTQKITVDARGEILQLKNTINTMVDQLSSFADEVTRVAKEVGTEGKLGGQAEVEGVSGTWRRLTESVNQLASNLTTQVRAIAEVSTAVAQGDLTRSIAVEAQGEVNELKDNINQMIANLRETTQKNAEQDWLNTNLARISGLMQGQRDLRTISRLIMSELTPRVSAQHGAFYMASGDGEELDLQLIASYAYKHRQSVSNHFRLGEGLVGQAAVEKQSILVTDAPPDYIRVVSGLGEAKPVNIIVLPILFEDRVLGVIELASFQPLTETHQTFLEQLIETIGVVLNTIIANMRTEEALQRSQSLTSELQSQSEELQSQQEELQRTNQELQVKAAQLSQQNRDIEVKNAEIESARRNLEEKAEQLALASKYKSQFLANMSHELRTPLNSLIILSRILADNTSGHLTDKEIEYAQAIHSAGNDLHGLINDILDLSKIEAGKMEINAAQVALDAIRDYVERTFSPLAEETGLAFEVLTERGVPATITTDEQRLYQILKNLLSNAFKFTEEGTVKFRVKTVDPPEGPLRASVGMGQRVVAFSVSDTGIGIPEDKLRLIFEAFQQGDGTTSRRYGGTGLGLSICRELTRALGGEIRVHSSIGKGSTFTVYLPFDYRPIARSSLEQLVPDTELMNPTQTALEVVSSGALSAPAAGNAPSLRAAAVPDDRTTVQPGDRVVLVIEDDDEVARPVLQATRERSLRGVVARTGDGGLSLAHELRPDAILLDLDIRDLDGLKLLAQLKQHPDTRHIPVYAFSQGDARQAAIRAGAAAYSSGPMSSVLPQTLDDLEAYIERRVKTLLIVDDDEAERLSVAELIGGEEDVQVTAVASSEEALEALRDQRFDCVVTDLKLPQMSGFMLLEHIKKDERLREIPVIVHTRKPLTSREKSRLKRYAQSIVLKDVASPERLLDETMLFLHRPRSSLPADKRRMLDQLHSDDAGFRHKKVMIVDDDVRNAFALAGAFEPRGIKVLFAENGKECLEALEREPDVDIVLMDLMMPEMDGLETTRAIRSMPRLRQLPIITLTAKAMKEDREKSIAAGASDYITKPVDIEQLLSLMRVWMHK